MVHRKKATDEDYKTLTNGGHYLMLDEVKALIADAKKEIPRGFSGVMDAKMKLAQLQLSLAILEQLKANGGGKWLKK